MQNQLQTQYELSHEQLEKMRAECGIDLIGVTTVEPFSELLPVLTAYRDKGFESGFEHPVIEERIDPGNLVPGAKSMLAIAIAYYTEDHASMHRPAGVRGVLSKYAWGLDYHRVLRDKMNLLIGAMENELGRTIACHLSVDTGPLVDRAVAERAGIGWFGKNCSIITEKYGSWVFLGQLVTDVLIEPGRPYEGSLCGDCDLCIRACPTGALVDPFTTDSSRCLSYITQMKGLVPLEFRTKMGTRIWGCDTCQVVCPSNKQAANASGEEFRPEPELAFPELTALLGLSSREFKNEFGATAAAWRGVNVIKRNALIALGNLKQVEAVPRILEFLTNDRPELRGTAAWAVAQMMERLNRDRPGLAGEVLTQVRLAAEKETDPAVQDEMQWAFTHNG
ncbi:MAG: queG [Bacilli bacterium]|nr:queG [Bacilli bacterium]